MAGDVHPCTVGPRGTASPGLSPIAGSIHINDIQGAGHRSPLIGQFVAGVSGVVTAVSGNAFWLQDPVPDADLATSEGILVFLDAQPTVAVGQAVTVDGSVTEFRPDDPSDHNLTTTEIQATAVTPGALCQPLPDPIILGQGGRAIPSETIEDDVTGDPGVDGTFDPIDDGLDFWESLEGMRVEVDNAVVV